MLMLALAGCTRTVETRAESALREDVAVRAEARERVTEVTKSGPETITTTVEEWEVGSVASVQAPSLDPVANQRREQGASLPQRAALVKRTVTVDQRGPVVDTRHEAASSTATATASIVASSKSSTESKTSYWPPWWLFAGGAGLLVLSGWAAWKFTPLGRLLAATFRL